MLTSTEKWLEPELMDVVRLFPAAGELVLSHTLSLVPAERPSSPACGEASPIVPSPACGEISSIMPSPACGEISSIMPAPACGGGVGEGAPSSLGEATSIMPAPACGEISSIMPSPACGGGVGEGARYLLRNAVAVNGEERVFEERFSAADETEKKSLVKRYAKLALYEVLSQITGKTLPWGSLTGIRPTRLAYREAERGGDFRALFRRLKVSEENIGLVARVLKGQEGVYERREGNVDLYVSLPFCPSKCSYCSFITAPIDRTRQFVPAYLDALGKELRAAAPLIGNLRSVYVGGGTPFVLEPRDLERVLKMLSPFAGKAEYTVEAGRPDVFTKEKLDLCQKYGVTRICVNAQSFSDETLRAIGRKHTRAQLYEAFEMVKPYPFLVNCDLIAGLTGESAEEFRSSVEQAIALSPENITVHTLCLKKGAKLKEERLKTNPPVSPAPARGEASLSMPSPACGEVSPIVPAPARGEASLSMPSPACGEVSPIVPAPVCGEASLSMPAPVCGEVSPIVPAPVCGEASLSMPSPACGGGVGEGAPSSRAERGRACAPSLELLPEENLAEMIAFSRDALTKAGYEPYYLYRQKYMAGSHENVGWAKAGCASVYNIDVMEEIANNLAVGANAITKRVILRENRVERLGSPKDIPSYLEKVEKLIEEKNKLFS